MWFRRDLRFEDHPALAKAAKRGPVLALFVFDSALTRPAGPPRLAFLLRTLRSLDQRLRSLGGSLTVVSGRPEEVVPELATRIGATEVHVSADFGPYGSARDVRVAKALGAVPLVATGSPYAVSPPRLLTSRRNVLQGVHSLLSSLATARLACAGGKRPWGRRLDDEPRRSPSWRADVAVEHGAPTRRGGGGTGRVVAFQARELGGLRRAYETDRIYSQPPAFPPTCASACCIPARCCPLSDPRTSASRQSWHGVSSTRQCSGPGHRAPVPILTPV